MSLPCRWVYSFDQSTTHSEPERVALLGGKGALLHSMTQAGFQVPSGFTITTEACRSYFDSNRSWPDGLWPEVEENIHRLEQRTGKKLGNTPTPLLLAVRSGAPESMPGMMTTILGCGLSFDMLETLDDNAELWRLFCNLVETLGTSIHEIEFSQRDETERSDSKKATCEQLLSEFRRRAGVEFPSDPGEILRHSISAVFNSWNSPAALAFRNARGISDSLGTAVNIQVMFPAEYSGVLFTRDPQNHDASSMVIEAVSGYGDRLVGGRVVPCRFYVRREDLSDPRSERHRAKRLHSHSPGVSVGLRDKDQSEVESHLTEARLRKLGRIGLDLERHVKAAADVEWGYADGNFVVFQARPTSDLVVSEKVERIRLAEIDRLRGLAASDEHFWVRHNLSETLPIPTPLTWSVWRKFMSGSGGFGRLYRNLGYRPSQRVCTAGFLELIAGRIYADPKRQVELFCAGFPLQYDLEEVKYDASVLERSPTHFVAKDTDNLLLFRLPQIAWCLWRSRRRIRHLSTCVVNDFEHVVLPRLYEYVSNERATCLNETSDSDLVAQLFRRLDTVMDSFGCEMLKPGLFGGIVFAELESALVRLLGNEHGRLTARKLVSNYDGRLYREQQQCLSAIRNSKAEVGDFVDRFGHRGPGEMELANPRWREIPDEVALMAKSLVSGNGASELEPEDKSGNQQDAVEDPLRQVLADAGAGSLHSGLARQLRLVRTLLPYRETGKHYLMLGYELLRDITQELARRWQLGRTFYYLELDELRQGRPTASRLDEIRQRQEQWQYLQRLPIPDVVEAKHLGRLGRATEKATRCEQLQGTALSAGTAGGRVVHATDERDLSLAQSGYVLVCRSFDPGLLPLMTRAAAIIVNRGGLLSHGAIVARQFNLPAVAVPEATTALASGTQVVVDGERGVVLIQVPDRR